MNFGEVSALQSLLAQTDSTYYLAKTMNVTVQIFTTNTYCIFADKHQESQQRLSARTVIHKPPNHPYASDPRPGTTHESRCCVRLGTQS